MLLSRLMPKQLHLLRVRSYPSVPLKDKVDLPRSPGIYYCLRGWTVLYIGLSNNLYYRWNSSQFGRHHRLDELLRIESLVGDVDLHYRLMPEWAIGFFEAVEIKRFHPRLNKREESIWDNLNFRVIKMLVVNTVTEFLILFTIGLVAALALATLL